MRDKLHAQLQLAADATETVGQLAARESDLDSLRGKRTVELLAAERAAGEAYLTAGGGPVDGAMLLRGEIAAIEQAIGAVRAKRVQAIAAKFRTQAEGARVTAGVKRAELDSLLKKRAQFVSQLAELEGVGGGRFEAAGAELKSSVLLREIGGLDHLARSMDAAQISDHGVFDSGSDVVTDEAVILAVLSHESAVPACAEVRAWLTAVKADATARNKGEDFEHCPRRVRLEWTHGVIDHELSYVFVPTLATPQDPRVASRGLDTATGTFHALAG